MEDVRAHGKVVWHPPVTTYVKSGKTNIPITRPGDHSYVQDPNYSLEKMFDRFADTILYRHAVIRFENNHSKARQAVTQMKEQTHQFIKDAKDLEVAHGLWVLACFVS